MSHSNFRELMAASLDVPLAPAERAALAEHIESCSACRAVWQALAEIDAELTAAPALAAPAGFAERAAARLAARASRRRVVGGGLILAVGAAGLLGLAALPLGLALATLVGQPATLIALARALAALFDVAGAVGGGLWLACVALLDWAAVQPLAGALALATVPLAGLWLYFFRRLSLKAVPVQ